MGDCMGTCIGEFTEGSCYPGGVRTTTGRTHDARLVRSLRTGQSQSTTMGVMANLNSVVVMQLERARAWAIMCRYTGRIAPPSDG